MILYIIVIGIVTGLFSALFFAFLISVKEYFKCLNEFNDIKNEK